MLRKALGLIGCIAPASAQIWAEGSIALWDKGMFGKNYPGQDGDAMVYWNTEDAVIPLKEADGRTVNDWFAHGRKAYPPKAGDFMVLPAGGTYSGDVACNRALTSIRNPQLTDPLPQYACPENTYGDGIGALHTANRYNLPPDSKFFGGSALAIAYTSDVASLQPNDLTVISVNYDSVWNRQINYAIPAGLPPCPTGGCLCTWNWIHQAGNGEGYPFEIYNNLYRCTVTGQTDSSKKVQRGSVPRECGSDSSKCVKGPKTPMYIYQADGNNLPHLDTPPTYKSNWGFPSGAQNDIFNLAAAPAPTTYLVNGWATPTGTNVNPAPTTTSLPSGWSAVGCNVDDPNTRALNGGATSSPDMTIESCVQSCNSRGFMYAGVEYGQECWCGNRVNLNLVSDSECNVPCAGDSLAKCGGGYRLSLFASNQAPAIPTSASKVVAEPMPTGSLPSGWSDMGCIIDDPNVRALNRGSTTSQKLTIPGCIAECDSKGFIYAGVEYGQECWCGDQANLRVASDGCNVPCGGDPSTICGGGYRINVFKKGGNTIASSSSSSTNSVRPSTSTIVSTSTTTRITSTSTSSPPASSSRSSTTSSSSSSKVTTISSSSLPPTTRSSSPSSSRPTTSSSIFSSSASRNTPIVASSSSLMSRSASSSSSSPISRPTSSSSLSVSRASSSAASSPANTSIIVRTQTVTVTVTSTITTCPANVSGRKRFSPQRRRSI